MNELKTRETVFVSSLLKEIIPGFPCGGLQDPYQACVPFQCHVLNTSPSHWPPGLHYSKFFLECISRFSLDGFSAGDLAGPRLMTLVKVVPHVTLVNHL